MAVVARRTPRAADIADDRSFGHVLDVYKRQLLGSVFARLFHRNIRPFFMSLGNDLLSPFRQAVSGFSNIAAVIRAERETGGSAVKAGTSYFMRGVRVYSGLIRRSLSYLCLLYTSTAVRGLRKGMPRP